MVNSIRVTFMLSKLILLNCIAITESSIGLNIVYAVNCGGSDHTDVHGIKYEKDPLTEGTASEFGTNLQILRVDSHDAILYQTERYHTSDFSYMIPLPIDDGEYTLVLKFCEVYFRSPNQKVFDVLLNDETVVSDLDIYKEAGDIGIAHDELITFHIKNGILVYSDGHEDSSKHLKLTFAKGPRDNPKINAFYIYYGPKSDIPMLPELISEADYDEFVNDEVESEMDDEHRRLDEDPVVTDPYAEQDTSQMFIPFLVALACFFPVLFCLCKL